MHQQIKNNNLQIKGRAEEEERRRQEHIEEEMARELDEDDDDDVEDEDEYDDNNVIDVNRNCADQEFECVSDQKCISLDKYCNYIVDCLDGSDEESCAITPGPIITLPTETEPFESLSSSTTPMQETIDASSTDPSTSITTTAANDEENTIEDKGDLPNALADYNSMWLSCGLFYTII